MPDPKPERPDVNDYLEFTDIIDGDHPSVEETAEQLTYGLKDSISKARVLYQFVKDQIFHSFKISATSVTKKASEVLEKGHGICYAQAHLLAALMRASGIPAGFCYQILYDQELEQFVVHGFNAVYLKELDKWIRLDASREDSWSFSTEQETPLLSINKALNEHDDFVIYQSPSRRVIKALDTAESVEELRHLLPAKI